MVSACTCACAYLGYGEQGQRALGQEAMETKHRPRQFLSFLSDYHNVPQCSILSAKDGNEQDAQKKKAVPMAERELGRTFCKTIRF